MTRWQRRARLAIGIFVVVLGIAVLFAFKGRTPPAPPAAVVPTEPGIVVQSTGGSIHRFKGSQDEVIIETDKQLTYADGGNKMLGVKITTVDKNGRTFIVTGKEGRAGK